MRFGVVRRGRDWRWLLGPALIVVLWAGLGLGAVALSRRLDRPVRLCIFKHLTGTPCPTCGLTRGVFALARGHPIEAWLYNPLLFLLLAVLGVSIVVRVLFGYGVEWHTTRRERIACWIVASVLFILNWLYVIRYVG